MKNKSFYMLVSESLDLLTGVSGDQCLLVTHCGHAVSIGVEAGLHVHDVDNWRNGIMCIASLTDQELITQKVTFCNKMADW